MHGSVWLFSNLFFTWCNTLFEPNVPLQVVDVGSYDWNGNLRTALLQSQLKHKPFNYTGIDIEAGPNVDVVLRNPYDAWPFETGSVNIVMSCSALKHDKFFWLTFLKMVDILKPCGLLLFMVPSNIPSHRYPVDSWRFLEDASDSLLQWARHNQHDLHMVQTDIFAHERVYNGGKAMEKVYTDSISIYWKSDFKCAHDRETADCTAQAASYNAAKTDYLKDLFSNLTYSFLRNMQKLGQVGGFTQPAEIVNRIAQYDSTFAQSYSGSAVDKLNIQEHVMWLEPTLYEYILCGFKAPMEAIVPTPAPNVRYIAYSVGILCAQSAGCRLKRSIALTAENLTHRHLLEVSAAEFAGVFKLTAGEIHQFVDKIWNERASLLVHLRSIRL